MQQTAPANSSSNSESGGSNRSGTTGGGGPSVPHRAETTDYVDLAAALVEDLTALKSYYDTQRDRFSEIDAEELTYLVSLARHRFRPADGTILETRGQVMVFGGAGAGKSTTVNILAGTEVAEVNTQAGFTRHPTAVYLPKEGIEPESWPAAIGNLKRSDRQEAGNLDADCYSTRTPIGSTAHAEFLQKFVLWDCPDVTTRDAAYYANRVIEIAALADLCVYVASDERYNDELPNQFFHSVLDAGKPTIVVMTKMSPLDADEFLGLFRQQVVAKSRHPQNVIDVYAVPAPLAGKVADLWTSAFPHGERLREFVGLALADLGEVRRRARLATLDLLWERRTDLIGPSEGDVQQWRTWIDLVRRAAATAVARYEKEYLEQSVGVDSEESLQTLLAAFALPGKGAYLWRVLEYLRTPYRILKAIARKYIDRRSVGDVDEEHVLDSVRTQLLDSLIVAVASRRDSHRFWDELHQGLLDQERLGCNVIFRDVHTRQAREIRLKNREASDQLEERFARSSGVTWTMRVGRLVFDLAAIATGFTIAYKLLGGWSLWSLGFVLLALGVADDIVRLLGYELVRRHREKIVRLRKDNIRELIAKSYTEVLSGLPIGLSETLQQVSQICRRLPKTIESLRSRLGAEGRT